MIELILICILVHFNFRYFIVTIFLYRTLSSFVIFLFCENYNTEWNSIFAHTAKRYKYIFTSVTRTTFVNWKQKTPQLKV